MDDLPEVPIYAIGAARRQPVTIARDYTITEAAEVMDRHAVGALVFVELDG
jgi:CBS domain-containing protein